MTEHDWQATARKWEARSKANDREADQLASERDQWRRKAREARNQAHTWRILYQDLLEQVARKLDIEHDASTITTPKGETK